jgi:hypothetical protein
MMVRMRIRMRGARSKLSSKVMVVRRGEGRVVGALESVFRAVYVLFQGLQAANPNFKPTAPS